MCVTKFTSAQNYTIRNLKINNGYSHYGVVFFNDDKVVFSSNSLDKRARGRVVNKDIRFKLFEGELGNDNEIVNPKLLDLNIKGRINMSSASFSPDGKYIYITTNINIRGGKYKHKGKSINLHIERGEYIEGKGWGNFESLPFCDVNYNYGQPVISPDGTALYFVSNIPEAKGHTDIFKVAILGNNEYGEIENLGELINSPRKEMFPYISKDNVLYFSSNRAGGKGGLDIYKYDLKDLHSNKEAELLPAPINGRGDDFCFIIKDNGKEGYFSSRRGKKYKGKGEDDIYYFNLQ
jgi:hypothetical protein